MYKGGDNEPNNANYTAALSFFVFPLLLLFLWWLAIRRFRRGWAADSSADKDQFRSDWLSKVNFWQWLCLFLITNTFMPVARVILKQFQCTCDGAGILNSIENDPDMCYSTIDSSKHCFPTHVALTQIVALVCGCLYIIGIPIFYYLLITKTVTLVLSTSRQYKLLTLEITRLAALPKHLKSEQIKKDLAEYRRIQFKLYYNVVSLAQGVLLRASAVCFECVLAHGPCFCSLLLLLRPTGEQSTQLRSRLLLVRCVSRAFQVHEALSDV